MGHGPWGHGRWACHGCFKPRLLRRKPKNGGVSELLYQLRAPRPRLRPQPRRCLQLPFALPLVACHAEQRSRGLCGALLRYLSIQPKASSVPALRRHESRATHGRKNDAARFASPRPLLDRSLAAGRALALHLRPFHLLPQVSSPRNLAVNVM